MTWFEFTINITFKSWHRNITHEYEVEERVMSLSYESLWYESLATSEKHSLSILLTQPIIASEWLLRLMQDHARAATLCPEQNVINKYIRMIDTTEEGAIISASTEPASWHAEGITACWRWTPPGSDMGALWCVHRRINLFACGDFVLKTIWHKETRNFEGCPLTRTKKCDQDI